MSDELRDVADDADGIDFDAPGIIEDHRIPPFWWGPNEFWTAGHAARLKPIATTLLCFLWFRGRHLNAAYPSISDIESSCGISRKTALAAVKVLETLGYVRIVRGGWNAQAGRNETNRYRVEPLPTISEGGGSVPRTPRGVVEEVHYRSVRGTLEEEASTCTAASTPAREDADDIETADLSPRAKDMIDHMCEYDLASYLGLFDENAGAVREHVRLLSYRDRDAQQSSLRKPTRQWITVLTVLMGMPWTDAWAAMQYQRTRSETDVIHGAANHLARIIDTRAWVKGDRTVSSRGKVPAQPEPPKPNAEGLTPQEVSDVESFRRWIDEPWDDEFWLSPHDSKADFREKTAHDHRVANWLKKNVGHPDYVRCVREAAARKIDGVPTLATGTARAKAESIVATWAAQFPTDTAQMSTTAQMSSAAGVTES